MRAYGATTTITACAGTLARSTAFSVGPWTVHTNGSIGGEASEAATLGSSLPGSSTASREHGPVSRRSNVDACLPEGSALHRGSEYNRRTGCGKTARPGLYGGCRVTGIPTVEASRSKAEHVCNLIRAKKESSTETGVYGRSSFCRMFGDVEGTQRQQRRRARFLTLDNRRPFVSSVREDRCLGLTSLCYDGTQSGAPRVADNRKESKLPENSTHSRLSEQNGL